MNLRSFIPVVIALLVLLAAAGVYGAGYYLLNTREAKAASLGSDIAQKNTQLNRAERAKSALSSLEVNEATVNRYLIAKSDVVPFLEALQSGGKALGASVDVLSVSDEKNADHKRISLSLSISGTFDAVMRTLGAIEYSPYDGVIESVTVSAAGVPTKGAATPWTAAIIYSVGVRDASSTPK